MHTIYLQIKDDYGNEPEIGVTWCKDKIYDTDEIYINIADILECNFDDIAKTSAKLLQIMDRDFPDIERDRYPVTPGGYHYTVKAVIEALFSDIIGD